MGSDTSKPNQPAPLSEADVLVRCAEWHKLEGERLSLGRAVSSRERRQKAIVDTLKRHFEMGDDEVTEQVEPFELGQELVDGYFSVQDALVEIIGQEELDRRKGAVPKKPKFFLHLIADTDSASEATTPAAPAPAKKATAATKKKAPAKSPVPRKGRAA